MYKLHDYIYIYDMILYMYKLHDLYFVEKMMVQVRSSTMGIQASKFTAGGLFQPGGHRAPLLRLQLPRAAGTERPRDGWLRDGPHDLWLGQRNLIEI